jgi:hypothetical protein
LVHLTLQVVGCVLLLCWSHVLGLWVDYEGRSAHAHSLSSTRDVIEARVKLELEKDQQETLLLSVIPAYIAAEVSPEPCSYTVKFYCVIFVVRF